MQPAQRKRLAGIIVLAVAAGCLDWVQSGGHPFRLLAPGGNIDFDSLPQNVPLMNSIEAGDFKKTQQLLEHGANPNSVRRTDEYDGYTAISAAATEGRLDIVQLLVAHGAAINATDFWGGNALLSASTAAQPQVVRYLIDHGADVNAEDDGTTALDYLEGPDFKGKTPVEQIRYRQVLDMLRQAGARHSLLYGEILNLLLDAIWLVLAISFLLLLMKFVEAQNRRPLDRDDLRR